MNLSKLIFHFRIKDIPGVPIDRYVLLHDIDKQLGGNWVL